MAVGSTIPKHVECSLKNPGTRRSDGQCVYHSPFAHDLLITRVFLLQNLVYRYNTQESDDGVGGEEGTFCLCTLW